MDRRTFLESAVSAPVASALAAALAAAGDPSRWSCDIVYGYGPTAERESVACDTLEQANELADWFGRNGDLRAEVVQPSCHSPVAHRGRARVAILADVYEWWAPRNWRDVPSGGAIVETSEPMSFAAARRQAKAFNQARREHPSQWALVVATDGRRSVKGGAV